MIPNLAQRSREKYGGGAWSAAEDQALISGLEQFQGQSGRGFIITYRPHVMRSFILGLDI